MKRRRILAIALLVLVGLFVFGALLIPRAVRRFFYPLAPPMPPVVSKSTTQILSELETTIKSKAPQVLEQMQKGLSDEEITTLERQAGIRLTEEIRTLYHWRNGSPSKDPRIAGPVPGHRFVPLGEALGLLTLQSNQVSQATPVQRAAFEVFAGHRRSWISLFDDGCGDGYFFDPNRKPQEGAVFYSFAEDVNYVFFPSLGNLLAGAVKCYDVGAFSWTNGPSGPCLVEDFERSRKIWNEFGSSNTR